MPALFLTAAEVAAAEAAAIAAAEAAAVHAAQVAAAQAAQVAAAEAATQAAAQAATQAATQTATTSGIQTLAQEVAAAPPTGIETLNMAQPPVTGPTIPSNLSTTPFGQPNPELLNAAKGADALVKNATFVEQTASNLPGIVSTPPAAPPLSSFNPAQYLESTMPGSVPPPPPPPPPMAPPAAPTPAPTLDYGFSRPDMGGAGGVQQGFGGTGMQARLTPEQLAGPNQYSMNQGLNYQSPLSASVNATPTPPPSGIESLFNKGLEYAKENKFSTLMGANTLYNALNKPKPYEKEKYKSTFRPGLYTGYNPVQPTPYQPQYAVGGLADLGSYSDGGRMLKGPGDGMSDDIPATIAGKQPARLANEEFVIPADVVSHLGNGSSEAGAKQLYKMMDRIRKARTGTKKQGKQINPEKYLA